MWIIPLIYVICLRLHDPADFQSLIGPHYIVNFFNCFAFNNLESSKPPELSAFSHACATTMKSSLTTPIWAVVCGSQ